MNGLQIFNYQDKPVRTIELGGELWWVLKDVCEVVGIRNHSNVVSRLDEDEKALHLVEDPNGKVQQTVIVNQPGLYSVILRSEKKEAKDFKRWVTHEVLPSIQRTGAYSMLPQANAPAPQALPDGMSMSGLASLIRITRRVMLDMGSTPLQVGAMTKSLFDTCGIPVPVAFTQQIPGQMCIYDIPAMEGKA